MYIHIDFENFANKLLSQGERNVLEGLDIRLCMDKENGEIYHEVCTDKVLSVEEMIEIEKVMSKFLNLLESEMKVYA